MLDKETALKEVDRYAELVAKEFSPSAVVLFGSYANGNPDSDSDIDVAVVFNGFKGNWLDTSAALWRLRRQVSNRIEPLLLDLQADDIGFAAHVLRSGKIIYRA